MRPLVCLFLLALASCATLNTVGMTPRCRDEYNACLNGCPKPRQNPNPNQISPDFDTPSCTQECNSASKRCN